MKLITIGVCIDNIDPKGVGRIRVKKVTDYESAKEKSVNYVPWDETDPFVALPFLPTNINFIPEIGQTVKILNYNPELENLNQEYIAGPFSTQYDFNAQSHSTQVLNTTFGTGSKKKKDIVNKDGDLTNPKSKNAFAKAKDFGVYGKYGSDALFTEGGVVLRGGKLISKETANLKNKQALIEEPIMAEKVSKLHLKKFPSKMKLEPVDSNEKVIEHEKIKYVIEYTVDNIITPSKVMLFVYEIGDDADGYFNTKNFRQHSYIKSNNAKLINDENDNISPTLTINLTELSDYSAQTANGSIYGTIASELRIHIGEFFHSGFDAFNGLRTKRNNARFPFAFRPTKEFTEKQVDNTIRGNIVNNVSVFGVGPEFGVIWETIAPIERTIRKTKLVTKVDTNSTEQTFSALTSDKIYLLSTDNNSAIGKGIDFGKLDGYEYSQHDYVEKIDPNCYSLVRGENLINFLRAVIEVLVTHQHNVVGPLVQTDYKPLEELKSLINTMENDLLNKSVRTN